MNIYGNLLYYFFKIEKKKKTSSREQNRQLNRWQQLTCQFSWWLQLQFKTYIRVLNQYKKQKHNLRKVLLLADNIATVRNRSALHCLAVLLPSCRTQTRTCSVKWRLIASWSRQSSTMKGSRADIWHTVHHLAPRSAPRDPWPWLDVYINVWMSR